jgi:hypothetical protein
VHALRSQPERAGNARRSPAHLVSNHHQHRFGVAREARQPDGHLAGEGRRAIEDDEPEGAAAQKHVGAPCAAGAVLGPHDEHAHAADRILSQQCPAAWIECASGVHVRRAQPCPDSRRDELPGQCRPAAAEHPHDLR